MFNLLTATIICTGVAPTTPKTNIEFEVRHNTFSTIRYEIAEGSLAGTAYVQSVGRLERKMVGAQFTSSSGEGPNATKLTFHINDNSISDAQLSHYSSGMKESPVECEIDE